MTRHLFSALLIAGCFSTTVMARAQATESLHIRISDLNLTRRADVDILHRRLEQALTQVCGANDAQDSLRIGAVDACRDEARLESARLATGAIAAAHRAEMAAIQGPERRR